MAEKITPKLVEEEMKKSYIDYAMSVIVGRALPDVRDGLKPVHRRVLFTMWENGLLHNKPFRKSANVVGTCMARYHPHGDAAIYDTLVRMAQDFSLRYPLIDGQGNWGSVDGDSAAAMRYCVTGDTLIATEHGLVRIDELSKDEKINTKILSKDKKINKASKWFDSGEHQTLKITTNKGYSLQGSYNHPVLTLVKDVLGKPKFCWKTLDKINKGDILVMDRSEDSLWPEDEVDLSNYIPNIKSPRARWRTLPKKLSENLAYILGALCAEGSISEDKIEFCNSDLNWISEFEKKWKIVFPDSTLHKFNRKPSSYGKKFYQRLECHCKHTLEFIRNIGLLAAKSYKKDIPSLILQSPKKVVSSFLKSYFEGDGCITSSRKMVELSCCSKSSLLLKNLQILLLRFGIDSFLRFDKYKNINKLYLRGKKNILRFYKNINFLSERKIKKLEFILLNYKKESSASDYVPFVSDFVRGMDKSAFTSKNNFDRYDSMSENYQRICQTLLTRKKIDLSPLFEYLLTYHYLFERVACVKKAEICNVYSIKVESDCHSFIGNGFINHNTEARLSKIAELMLEDIDKETVDFQPNFDASLNEPVVLPSKIPNLLINGSAGIAVGMATNIPPHNVSEICSATIFAIDKPDCAVSELLHFVNGPDFPTAGMIVGRSGINDAYSTGRGKVIVRAKSEVIEDKGKQKIIVTEIPYQVNKSMLIEEIAGLVRDKKIIGISDIRDESDKKGMTIVFELKRDANAQVVLNQLYNHTRMQQTFGIIMLVLVNNEPRILNLKDMVHYFIQHRKEVVTRRTGFELKKAEERAHILEGLIVALNNIDAVVKKIKASKDVNAATNMLVSDYKLTEMQAKAILDMKLQKLASLEQEKIRSEHSDLLKLIINLKEILTSEQKIYGIIKDELKEIREKFGDGRKTQIIEAEGEEITEEHLVKPEDVVVTVSHSGYMKRTPMDTYRQQGRGGKGIVAAETKEGDFLEHVFVANTLSFILLFTDKGKVHWLKVYEVPEASRHAKGKAIINFVQLDPGENVTAFVPVKEFDEAHYLFMATKKGTVKKTNLIEYSRPRKGGIIAITLEEGDGLIGVELTSGSNQIVLASKKGLAVRFEEADVRACGRSAMGVRGVRLKEDDEVVGMVIADDTKQLLSITENGYGKRTAVSEYRLIGRGGSGVINIQCSERNGDVVSISSVTDEDEIVVISKNGIMIRIPVRNISLIGRNTQGVRIMKLEEGDRVVAAAKVVREE